MSYRHACPCGTGATPCPNPATGRPLCADVDNQVGTGWARDPSRPLKCIPVDRVAWDGGPDEMRLCIGGAA